MWQTPQPAQEPYKIGYARVSSEDQDLRLQIEALKAAGVGADSIYTDKASGAEEKRSGLIAALKDAREGDLFVVWKLDRLSRRLSTLVKIMDRLKEKRVGFKVLTEPIDTTTAAGTLLFHILASFAEFERNMGVERTKAGLAAARAQGRVGGRQRTLTAEKFERVRRLTLPPVEGGEGLSVKRATKRVGMSPTSYYRWMEERENAREPEATA